MATPGTVFERRAERAVPGIPTDTGTAFFVGFTESGPADVATEINSIDEYEDTYGDGAGVYATMYDAVEAFFGEGGATVWVGRVVGPAASLPADDDNANATDTEWATALGLFDATYGPGQVAAPGRTTTVAHTQLITHAAARNRTALLDPPFEETKANLITAAAALDELAGSERAGLFAQWLQIPDSTAGVDRFVPPSAIVAGLIARSDAETDPGRQPIASNGQTQYAIAAATVFTDDDRTDLYEDNRVNVFLDDPGGLRLYGFRSTSADDSWYDLSHNRLFMELEARSRAQDEFFVGLPINNTTIGEYNAAKSALCAELYDRGSLYGDTAEDAYRVITDPPVNTATTAAARQLLAEVRLRVAESAEIVRTIATKVPVTTTV